MTFSDDDLKRLKERITNPKHDHTISNNLKIPALLARLEAAEEMAEHIKSNECCGCDEGIKLYETWCKKAGK
jgi:hypothetical protein